MAFHSSNFAWKIPQAEKPGRSQAPQFVEPQRVRHDQATEHAHTHTHTHNLTSFTYMIISRSIHVVASGNISFFFVAG